MSTYTKVVRHPNTGKWEEATFHDDYFAPHVYGVEFPSDGIIYPTSMLKKSNLKEFWAEDVITAYENVHGTYNTVKFLNELQKVYELRWKHDPEGGNGAVEYYKEKFGKKCDVCEALVVVE